MINGLGPPLMVSMFHVLVLMAYNMNHQTYLKDVIVLLLRGRKVGV